MAAHLTLIDWFLAEWIAGHVAGAGDPAPSTVELAPIVADAQARVIEYTGLIPTGALPAPETVTRPQWVAANIASTRALIEPMLTRALGRHGGKARRLGARERSSAQLWLSATSTLEIGVLIGYLGRRVLGQYELVLLREYAEGQPPRLLFVMPNLAAAIDNFNADQREFVTWVALHEVTHAVQFGGVAWLQDHLAGLIRELMDSAEQRITTQRRLRLPSRAGMARVGRALLHGDFLGVVASAPERDLLDQAQAMMAVIEGHAEHVMDAVAPELLPSLPQLRRALDQRRKQQSPLGKLVSKLLGLEMKLKQYEHGKRFCDEIVRREGTAALTRLFTAPEMLPTLREIDDPDAWLARVRA